MGRLTADEAAVYDRQIRVWGAEAQGRLGAARVALWGCGPLAAEAAKNLALAGVGRLALLPPPGGCAADAGGPRNFLAAGAAPGAPAASAMAATLREMNPLVDVLAVPGSPEDVLGALRAAPAAGAGAETVAGALVSASLVIAVSASLAELRAAAAWSRANGKPFFGALPSGFSGMFFADLLEHAFTDAKRSAPPPPQGAGASTSAAAPSDTPETRLLSFVSLEEALAVRWDAIPRRCSPLFPALQVRDALERELGRAPGAGDAEAALRARGRLAQEAGLPPERAPCDAAAATALLEADGGHPAACSVVGGVLANEVLKAATHKGEPLRNFFFFSAADGAGKTEFLRGGG